MYTNNKLTFVVDEFRKVFGSGIDVLVSAPGRLDFLNTHQDYKGLPVVAIAINLRTFVAIKRTNSSKIIAGSGNILDEGGRYLDSFSIDNIDIDKKRKNFGNYVRAAVLSLKRNGYEIGGANIWIRSWVPIASGLGSSGTLLVSLIGALNEAFNFGLSVKEVAEYAYIAEHDILGIPCGRLDQYAAAFGGVTLITTRPPYTVEKLTLPQAFFAIIDTGIKHSTAEIHSKRQREIDEGLAKLMSIAPDNIREFLGLRYWEPLWDSLDLSMLWPYMLKLDVKSRNRIVYTIKAHRSTMAAVNLLKARNLDPNELANALEIEVEKAREMLRQGVLTILGYIMTYQHRLLSRLYDVSLPEIDRLVDKLLDFGAEGAKLSGAGLGGAVIALFSRKDTAENAVEEIIKLGYGVRGWIVEVDDGLKVHGVVS